MDLDHDLDIGDIGKQSSSWI